MPFLPGVAPSIRGEELNIASALLKQVLVLQDFETWTCVRKDYLPNDNYVEASGNHFCMIVDENYNPIENVIIIMKSTQKTKSNEWNSMTRAQKIPSKKNPGTFVHLPSFAQVYRLQTTKEKNKKGK